MEIHCIIYLITLLISILLNEEIFVTIIGTQGAFSKKFMHFGPSKDPKKQTKFLGTKIDTWGKVIMVMSLGFFSTLFTNLKNNKHL